MTAAVDPSERWKKLHRIWIWTVVSSWAGLVGAIFLFPQSGGSASRAIILGTAPFIPHMWFGLRIWHNARRTGIGIPIAILTFRLFASLILFSFILWQFPEDRRILAWSGAIVVIVSTSIEAFVFAKGVGRL